ncbi:MAG: Gldg family protein [Clostridia bacterium]|nr:Gldg family protein [Clostridia bacterium]
MKKQLSGWISRFREPRWRHGKLGALLMAMFVLICVLLNVGVRTLEDEYGWKKDLSFNRYATTGEETRAAMDSLTREVELYLLYQNGAVDSQLLALLERYEALSDRVEVLVTDINRNPGILTRFEPDFEHALEADTVIVNCPDTGRYKLLSYAEDFITQSYNIDTGEFELAGLAYEKSLTEAIVYVAQDAIPTVGVLSGHGELDETSLALLLDFFKSSNCDSRMVNMLAGDGLDEIDLLLIAAPQKDLSTEELEKISAFAQEGKSLLVLRDYIDPIETMPNYMSLLRSYGVVPLAGVVVAGAEDTGSYYEEQLMLTPYMEALDMTQPLLQTGTDILLMPASSAFETPGEPDGTLTVGTVLKTGPNAYVRDLTDGTDSIEQQPGDREGELSVAVFAHRMHMNGNISRLFAMGCSSTFTTEYIYQRSYVEEFLLMLIGEMLPDKTVSLGITASAAVRPGLTVGSKTIGIALTVALPLLVIMAGLIVLLPRRSR